MSVTQQNIDDFITIAGSEISNELDDKKYGHSIEKDDKAATFTIKFFPKTEEAELDKLKEHVEDIAEKDLPPLMKGDGADRQIKLEDMEGGKGFFIKIPYDKINFPSLCVTPGAFKVIDALKAQPEATIEPPAGIVDQGTKTPLEAVELLKDEATKLDDVVPGIPTGDSTPLTEIRLMISECIIPTLASEVFNKNVIISNHTHTLTEEEKADKQLKFMVKIPRYERGDEDIKALVKQANEIIGDEPALTLKQRHSDSSIYYISFKDRGIDQDKHARLTAHFSRGFDSISNNMSNTNMADLNNLLDKRTR